MTERDLFEEMGRTDQLGQLDIDGNEITEQVVHPKPKKPAGEKRRHIGETCKQPSLTEALHHSE